MRLPLSTLIVILTFVVFAISPACGIIKLGEDPKTYLHVTAMFGPSVKQFSNNATVVGNITVTEPETACSLDSLDNVESLAGNIALIKRGDCDFIDKIKVAEAAQAKAAVIYNNKGDDLYRMYSSDDYEVTIPSVFVAESTGGHLKGSTIALNSTGEYTFGGDHGVHSYFLFAMILFGLSVTLGCTLAVTVVGYIFMRIRKARQRSECRNYVAKLKTRKFNCTPDNSDEQCVICLENFEQDQVLKILPCKHEYHRDCIDPWLLKKSSLCPVCKQNIVKGEDLHCRNRDQPANQQAQM